MVCALLGAAPAGAAGGTWGATHAPYVDGTVCSGVLSTSPLASWDFGDPALDFLTTAVTSNGFRDSAQLPTADADGRFTSPVTAGQFGFTSDAAVATFAALLDRYGASHAADVAAAVLAVTDPAHVPSCADTAAAASLVAQAQQVAGPYQVALSVAHTPIEVGSNNTVTATVTNPSGAPVAGVRVALDADSGVFTGSASSATVTTGSDGRASAAFAATSYAGSVSFTASAAVSVGLTGVSAFGNYAGAIYADDPQEFTADKTVPIDQTADPHIALTGLSAADIVNAPLRLQAGVTGMRGHSGEVQLSVSRPTPLDAGSLCSDVAPAAVGDNPEYTSAILDITGDGTADGGTWTPTHAGCYRIGARVATTDATPAAAANATPVVVTVLDSSARLTTGHDVVGPGTLATTLQVAHSHSLPGTAQLQLRGPMTPADADCTGVNWSSAPRVGSPSAPVHGDQRYTLHSAALTKPGCYRVQASVALTLPGGAVAQLPVDLDGSSDVVYLLHPTLTATADQIWSVSPATVPAHVAVSGTFGQPGEVKIEMMRAPASPFGCSHSDYAHATSDGSGPATAVKGDGTFAVTSGHTPSTGCYTLVPTITMDANKTVTAHGVVGAPGSTVIAGVNLADAVDQPTATPLDKHPTPLSVWPALVGYVLMVGLVGGVIVMIANDARRTRRPLPGVGLFD